MKLVRAFIAFVVVSLFVGIGTAFNGQSSKPIEEINNPVENIKTESDTEEISTKIVDKEILEQPVEQEKEINNSFSDSKQNSSQEKKKDSTTNTKSTTKTPQEITQNISPVEEKQEQIQEVNHEIKEEKEEKTNNTTSTDEQFNAMYYSITKGNAEYSTLAECNSVGNRIKNNELDEILDWNENNPDNFKQPVIKAHWCYEVMKDGKIHYFLHFITETGANLDNELKNKY